MPDYIFEPPIRNHKIVQARRPIAAEGVEGKVRVDVECQTVDGYLLREFEFDPVFGVDGWAVDVVFDHRVGGFDRLVRRRAWCRF